jgi:hypothetical protein
MDQRMERLIIKEITQFFDSPIYKELAKQKNTLGSKLRIYKSKNEKGQLSSKAAISLLLDMDRIDEIIFKK